MASRSAVSAGRMLTMTCLMLNTRQLRHGKLQLLLPELSHVTAASGFGGLQIEA